MAGASNSLKSGASGFVQSELFAHTFREGMTLVEETANYLDGEGREASKELAREAALSYAGASMRLTTRLMQIASWLLVLRAVREGEMTLEEAKDDKYRLNEKSADNPSELAGDGLPPRLIELIEDSGQLYARISRLDDGLFRDAGESDVRTHDAVGQQQALLKAFGQK